MKMVDVKTVTLDGKAWFKTQELADRVGEAAVAGAVPLKKNAYKVPLTRSVVARTLVELAARG